ncbi:hypothetical protein BASA60_006950 [Batrachochytrium salamandrivorans]|nr:hypothetical protein BASA60_006950 [Batrachochytrium salamandrivorans]
MPYGLQSDEDSQLASILERLQLLEAENASLKQSISQAQSQAQSQPQEAPQHIAPPLPQYRQEPSVSLPDKFNGNRLKTAHLSQPAGAGVSYQPQPIQLGGNQGGHSRDPLNRRGCVVVQSHPREPPTTTTPPSIPGQLSRPC